MQFKVVNEKDEIIQGATFNFDYNGEQKVLSSDSEGKITLQNLKAGTEVAVYQKKDELKGNEYNFICEKDKEYILKVIAPEEPKFDMRFKVIDPNGQFVPNAKVKIKYNDKSVDLVTDIEGYTLLKDVKPDTQVKVVAIGKKQKKEKVKKEKQEKGKKKK